MFCVAMATPALAEVPTAPNTLRRDRLSDTEVLVTWRDRSDDEDGFEILRRGLLDEEYESRGTVGADVTSFVDEAERGTLYVYRVVAFNEDGASGPSNLCYVNRNPPAIPVYFNVRLISLYQARVSWSDRSNGEGGFEIQRAPFGGRFKTIAKVPANTEVYDDGTLDPANTYTYRVRAIGKPAQCWDNSRYTVERTLTTKGGVRVLQVELRGRGVGTVTSIPEGISCGPKDDHCTAEFPLATDVTLVPKANDKSFFYGWFDILRCEEETGPCTFNMGKDRIIGAAFRPKR